MSKRILVADDSPTIQKVVGITLAKSDYELTEALSETEMLQELEADNFDLVLLDFNLSEENDGYKLCEKIREASEETGVLAMLGTFDSVDDKRLEELGVFEQVVKPFESSIFIQKISDALSRTDGSEASMSDQTQSSDFSDEEMAVEGFESTDEEDEWSMSSLQDAEEDEDESEDEDDQHDLNAISSNPTTDELRSEMADWGVNIPSVIGEDKDESSLMPPKMGEPTSKMVSLDELMDASDDHDSEEDLDKTDPQMSFSPTEDSPELLKEFEAEADEAGDFWAVDEDLSADDGASKIRIDLEQDETEDLFDPSSDNEFIVEDHPVIEEVGPKLEKIDTQDPTVAALNNLHAIEQNDGHNDSQVSSHVAPIDAETFLKEIRPQLKELIKEVLTEMGSEATERVAWEVIPDLAENLIRKEVENLSKKVQEKHSLN